LKWARECANTRFQAENLLYLGTISFKLGDPQGIHQLLEAETLTADSHYNELMISIYEGLINMFKVLNNHNQIAKYQEKLIELRESVYNAGVIENLSKTEADYVERENIARIQHQKGMITLNGQIIERQRLIGLSIGGVLILTTLLILVVYKENRFKRKINRLLELRVAERNQELKNSIEKLERSHQDQQKKLNRAHQAILDCAKGIRVICNEILTRNPKADTRECIVRMILTTDQMLVEAKRNLPGPAK
jgi:hypothetical protein